MITNNTKYLITFVKISLSFPTVAVAAVATAILCGEIIFPAVLPTVFAATSQIWLIFNSAPVLACNLDSLNEGIILKSLKEESQGRTVVLVSHRESTMGIADEVYHMDAGRVS